MRHLQYDEFFVTPQGRVDIRKFGSKKGDDFVQTTISVADGIIPDTVFFQLQPADREAFALWGEIRFLLNDYPYPAHAYVFGISKDRGGPQADIQFQLSTALDLSQVRCWKKSGKRWGWETPSSAHNAAICVEGAFEKRGVDVGGGYQGTYFPITVPVRSVEDAEAKLRIAAEVFDETNTGEFLLEAKPLD